MCGICGILVTKQGSDPLELERDLTAMMKVIAPRGPDGQGKWINSEQSIFLGHQRLSIIGLTNSGAQPMRSGNLRYTISFNGEIYNYKELTQELAGLNVFMRGDSDTEVLLEMYSRFGVEAFSRLRGMFAFAIWDEQEKSLVLVRDTFGMKPLYYSINANGVFFSSQVKSLLKVSDISRQMNEEGCASYLIWGHLIGGDTLFQGVTSLKPGSWIKLKGGEVAQTGEFSTIYSLYTSSVQHSPQAPTLRDLLIDTVEHHLIADVPVGIFLSSGIDSSVLLAAAAELGVKPKTLTLAFEEFRGTSLDESVLAEKTARYYGSDHETVFLSQKQIEDSLDDFFSAMDQPTTDGLNTWLVSNVAHKLGLKAALSGVGADEFLGGYPSFWQIQELLSILGPLANIPKFGKMVRQICYPTLRKMKKPKQAGMLEYSKNVTRAFFLRRAQMMPYEVYDDFHHMDALQGVYDKCLSQFLKYEEITEGEVAQLRSIGGNFMAISYLEASNYMANRLLVDSDWAGMNHSLEIRMPFVDLAFVSGVIEKMKTSRPYTKLDLASSLNISLPDEIRLRKKTGFAVPVKALSLFGKKINTENERWSNIIFNGYMKSLQ